MKADYSRPGLFGVDSKGVNLDRATAMTTGARHGAVAALQEITFSLSRHCTGGCIGRLILPLGRMFMHAHWLIVKLYGAFININIRRTPVARCYG